MKDIVSRTIIFPFGSNRALNRVAFDPDRERYRILSQQPAFVRGFRIGTYQNVFASTKSGIPIVMIVVDRNQSWTQSGQSYRIVFERETRSWQIVLLEIDQSRPYRIPANQHVLTRITSYPNVKFQTSSTNFPRSVTNVQSWRSQWIAR